MLGISNLIYADQTSVNIKAEEWAIPRHGETLIKHAGLRKIVNRWQAEPEHIIEIRYPGGEEGELWVKELMDWLVALGVPSNVLVHIPGSGAEDIITLVLVKGKNTHE